MRERFCPLTVYQIVPTIPKRSTIKYLSKFDQRMREISPLTNKNICTRRPKSRLEVIAIRDRNSHCDY